MANISRQVATDYGTGYDSDIVESMNDNLYVDDSIVSRQTASDAVRVASGLLSLLAKRFKLVKFASNDRNVLEARFKDFKRRVRHSAPREEIAKSGTERLCALTSSISLQSFNLVARIISEEIEIEDFKRRAPTPPLGKIAKSD